MNHCHYYPVLTRKVKEILTAEYTVTEHFEASTVYGMGDL